MFGKYNLDRMDESMCICIFGYTYLGIRVYVSSRCMFVHVRMGVSICMLARMCKCTAIVSWSLSVPNLLGCGDLRANDRLKMVKAELENHCYAIKQID